MNLLVIGASGQVARALNTGVNPDVRVETVGRPSIDLEKPETLRAAIDSRTPDIVVCVGAYTAVDAAESDPAKAHLANALGPEAVSRACAERQIPIIHVSTDFVFAGDKATPYVETDPAGPLSVYGKTKLQGEQLVAAANPRHVILRTAWVYAAEGKNFVRTMLRLAKTRSELGVVGDQRGCPTYASDLAHAIVVVAQTLASRSRHDLSKAYGIFHVANSGECSWRQFAEAIFRVSASRGGPVARVNAISTADYPTPARRPANSRLDCSKLEEVYGLRLRPWPEALEVCMDQIASSGFDVG